MASLEKNTIVKVGVIGVGGGGCNAVEMMCEERDTKNDGENSYTVFNDVKILAANTDVQALEGTKSNAMIQLGPEITKGQGAGGKPEIGRMAAEESKVDIATAIDGLEMLFITAGMGGGTGTGAAPVVAEVAKEAGILTVGLVTKPFDFEARKKRKYALEGMEALRQNVDALVTIPNQRLIDLSDPNDMAFDMFRKPNEVLISAVRNLSELITNKSYINVDFADVTSIVKDMGLAMFGFGSATGEGAAINAVKEALNNPLLADFTISGSKKMLLHFSGAPIPMKEFSEASSYLSDKLHEDGDMIWGASKDENCDKVHALIVAEATEESFSNVVSNISTKKVEEKDQGTIFDVKGEKPVEETIIPEIIEDVDVTMEELAPAAKNEEEVFEIDRDGIVDVEDFDEELVVPEGREYNMEDTNIPAYLRRGRVDSQAEEKEKKLYIEKKS